MFRGPLEAYAYARRTGKGTSKLLTIPTFDRDKTEETYIYIHTHIYYVRKEAADSSFVNKTKEIPICNILTLRLLGILQDYHVYYR